MANHGRKLKIEIYIRRKEKVEKATEFIEKMKNIQKEARAALRKAQEKNEVISRQGKCEEISLIKLGKCSGS